MKLSIGRPGFCSRGLLIAAAAVAAATISPRADAQTFYWTPSGGSTASWGNASNWSDTAAAGGATGVPGASDTATFNTTDNNAAAVVTLDADRAAAGLSFNTSGGATITAGPSGPFSLTLGAGGVTLNATSGPVVIGSATAAQNVPIVLGTNAQSWLNNVSPSTGSTIITVRGPITAGQSGSTTLTLGGTIGSSALNNIIGAISDGGVDRTVGITLNPSSSNNRWTLSGNNAYTGATTISSGALTIGNVNALGATSTGTTVAAGSGLFFRSSIGTIAQEPLALSGTGPGGTAGALRNVNGANNWTGPIAANTSSGGVNIGADAGTLTLFSTADITTNGSNTLGLVTGTSGTMQINSTISGPAPVVKSGAGLLTYTFETKTYTGSTAVNAGTLQVDVGITATSAVTVASAGTLRGSGGSVINTAATTTINGTVAAGAGGSTIGQFTTGPLSITATGGYTVDIDSGTVAGDLINVTGNLTLDAGNASTLAVADLAVGAAPLPAGAAIPIIDYSGAWIGGLFTMTGVGVLTDNGTVFTVGNSQYQLDYNFGGANGAVALVAVPEPGSLAALSGLGILVLGRRRRRAAVR